MYRCSSETVLESVGHKPQKVEWHWHISIRSGDTTQSAVLSLRVTALRLAPEDTVIVIQCSLRERERECVSVCVCMRVCV